MTRYKIVIAEDDTVLRDLCIRKFSATDYDVHTASDGEDALQKIAEIKPDLVLLDINMPVLDGFGVLEKLPKAERAFPIVILSNFDDQANHERANSYGIDGYFVKKDMTIKSLLTMVEELLSRKSA